MYNIDFSKMITTDKLYKAFGYREHRNLKQLISEHIELFDGLGDVRRVSVSDTGAKGGRPSEAYAINLDQCLLLSGLVKNGRNSNKSEILLAMIGAYSKSSLLSIFNLISTLDIDDVMPDRFVYVVRESQSGRYKIGISKDPERRVRELNVGNPERLTLVHSYKAEESGYQSEALAHAMFEADRIRGEWFGASIDLNLLPNYSASCKQNAYCDCKECSIVGDVSDAIVDKGVMSRDAFISMAIRCTGHSFDSVASSVDALEDLGAIHFE